MAGPLESKLWFWPDVGQFYISISILGENFLPALEIMAGELRDLKTTLIKPEDLNDEKESLKIDAYLRFSQPLEVALFYARQWANLGYLVPLKTYLSSINKVTPGEIRRVSNQVFVKKRMVLVAVGPISKTKREIRKALKFK